MNVSGAARDTSPVRSGPYVGLVPYSEDDAAFFFGRTSEIQIISANLVTSSLTLLYGPSGVGKSSVLHAGVTWSLRRRSEQSRVDDKGPPEFAVVIVSSWRDDPVSEILSGVENELSRLGRPGPDQPRADGLMAGLRSATARLGGDLLIILDQFEEYFLYHALEDGSGTFAVDFPRIVESSDLRVNFLAAIREDALARLDLFKGRMTNPFANRLSIDHLDEERAREAIEGPVAEFDKQLDPGEVAVTVDPQLVDIVLDEVTTGRVLLGQSGVGTVVSEGTSAARRIETPFLQLVMTRVWDEEMAAGSTVLRRSTLERLGGADRIVRTHLDAAMQALPAEELDIAASIFHYLVTPSGTKIAHSADDLAEYAEHGQEQIEPLLEELSAQDTRILRPVAPPLDAPGPTRYEIFHDVLAPAVLDWRNRHVQLREQETAQSKLAEEKQHAETRLRAERRRSRLFVALAATMSLLVLLTAWGWLLAKTKGNEAREQAETQRSTLSGAEALLTLPADPAESVALALGGMKIQRTPTAELALRQALPSSHLEAELDPGIGALTHVEFTPDGEVVTVGADSVVRVWDPETMAVSELDGHDTKPINGMAIDHDGDHLVTVSDDGRATIWDMATEQETILEHATNTGPLPVVAAAFDPTGSLVATATHGGGVWIWDRSAETPTVVAKLGREKTAGSDWINSLAFDQTSTRLVAGTGEAHVLVYEDDGSGWRLVVDQPVDTTYVNVVAFAPNGKTVASGNSDGTVSVLDAQTGERRYADRCCYSQVVNALHYSNDGRLIVAAGGKIAESWSPDSGGYQAIMLGHTDWIYDTSFSPDGKYVLTASSDGTARVWSAATGKSLLTLSGHTDALNAARFSPDGASVATVGQDGTARLWDVRTGSALFDKEVVWQAVWGSDGTRVITADGDGHARVWDPAAGRQVQDLFPDSNYFGAVYSVDVSADGAKALLSGDNAYIEIVDVSSGDLLDYCCSDGAGQVFSAAYTPDGSGILTVSEKGAGTPVTLWDVNGKHDHHAILNRFEKIGHDVLIARMSPDQHHLFIINNDGTAALWDADGSTKIAALNDVRRAGAFSAHGKYLVTDGPANSAQLWNGETGDRVATLPGGGAAPLTAFAISADGAWVVAGDADGITYIWDLERRTLLGTMRMHADYINSVEVGPNHQILTASDDWTAKIYTCDTCVPIEQLEQQAQGYLDELAALGAPQYREEAERAAAA